MQKILSLKNIEKNYGNKDYTTKVLKGIDLDIYA